MESADHFAASAFRQYGASLYRFLLRRVKRSADADDLAQEVFVRLLRVSKKDRIAKPLSYLYGIAAHVIYEFQIREAQARVTYDSAAVERFVEHAIAPLQDEAADRLHLQQQLERALSRLPPMQRAVLLMVKRDGFSHGEAAKAAGLTVQTVEKYMVNAKAQIKLEWDV